MPKTPRAKNGEPRAGPICEYGSVQALLETLSTTEVFLAPVFRSYAESDVQVGALLSAQRPNESCVLTCIALAAEATLIGEQGRLLYPYCQAQQDRQVRPLLATLQQELLAALQLALPRDPRVHHLRYPAAYQVSDLRLWNREALEHFPVAYQNGHWMALIDACNAPS